MAQPLAVDMNDGFNDAAWLNSRAFGAHFQPR
jgi:hypothetical protein